MIDIYFQDPTEIPLPPEEVHIRELRVEPWIGGQRVKVYVELDAFQQPPNLTLSIRNTLGKVIAQIAVIESITRKIELNMHIRETEPVGEYTLLAVLYYELPAEEGQPETMEPRQPFVVDRKDLLFHIFTENGSEEDRKGKL